MRCAKMSARPSASSCDEVAVDSLSKSCSSTRYRFSVGGNRIECSVRHIQQGNQGTGKREKAEMQRSNAAGEERWLASTQNKKRA